MAEEKPAGKLSGWVKAMLTSVLGIMSGAALMYLTPLVNNVIKPAKPVPNFAQQTNNLTVTFNNRSTGGRPGFACAGKPDPRLAQLQRVRDNSLSRIRRMLT